MSLSSEISKKFQIDEFISSSIDKLGVLSIDEVIVLKVKIESELDKYIRELNEIEKESESETGSGTCDLIDEEGFPRGDVDIISVKFIKRNILLLKNDLSRVSDVLYELINNNSVLSKKVSDHTTSESEKLEPFLRFTEICVGSPADRAGLNDNDELVAMNDVSSVNYRGLLQIKRLIDDNLDQEVKLKVLRGHEVVDLVLTPARWNGAGLGCKVTEIK